MRLSIRTLLLLASCFATGAACARNSVVSVNLRDTIAAAKSAGQIDGSVSFYLAGAATPMILERMGEGVTNRKTNAAGKSDAKACRWVLITALLALQNEARARGANAVVEIISYYKKQRQADPVTVQCHAGAFVAGIALKGKYAKVQGH